MKLRCPNFQAIPQMTRTAPYTVTVAWSYLERHFKQHVDEYHLDVDPDFQRPHVWDRDKQIAFVEFCLRGGKSGNQLYLNCPGWNRGAIEDYVLVDGKQRLHAALAFIHNEIPAFGYHYQEYGGTLRLSGPRFDWCVNDLSTRSEVLQWYLDLNTGGVVHTAEEISKVKDLLDVETSLIIRQASLSEELQQQLLGLPCDVNSKDKKIYQRCVQLVKQGLAIQHGSSQSSNFQPSPAGWELMNSLIRK